jgi:hypothetical protein
MKSQIGDIILLYIYIYIYIYISISQGFINKSSYKSQDTWILIQISYPTETNANVLVMNSLNMSSLSNPKMSQRISDLMICKIQHFKQTNEMQTIVRCIYAQLTIKHFFFFF